MTQNQDTRDSLNELANNEGEAQIFTRQFHELARQRGWWTDPKTGLPLDVQSQVPGKLLLIHSEISEACEGHRKNLMDEHLMHRTSIEVELADAVIRIFDLAGALNLDVVGAMVEKAEYNAVRADHDAANRQVAGGKSY